MDAGASIIAVVQITERVITLSHEYYKAVKGAKSDIQRLQNELGGLKVVFSDTQTLLEEPHGAVLKTSQQLCGGLKAYQVDVQNLEDKLRAKQFRSILGKLKWPFKSKEFDELIATFHRHRDTIAAGLTIDQTALLVHNYEHIEDDERLKILTWISSVPHGKHHDTVKEARTGNTCEWLLRHEQFQKWDSSRSSVIMWLRGSPGAGKTFLTSKVIDHVLQSSLERAPSREGFAFFYCNRNEEERRKPLSVLRSYTRQLTAAVGHPKEMRAGLRALWKESILQGREPSMDTCKKELLESVNLYDRTTLVLDALDECDPSLRLQLVEAINFLRQHATKPLRVFVSSRPDGDIRAHFEAWPNIEIEATDNADDIKKFVHAEIVRHHRWAKMSPSLRDDIVGTLLTKSQGMFQWAFLQIRELLQLKTEGAMRERLGRLPRDLKAAYDEILCKISEKSEHERTIADRAFKWVLCAKTPFTSLELLRAMHFSPEGASHMGDDLDEDLLLSICNNLLVLDSQRRVWRFSHLSVAEYFEEHRWPRWRAHCFAAKTCLQALLRYPLDEGSDEDSLRNLLWLFPFFCLDHLEELENDESYRADPELVQLLTRFLGPPTNSSQHFQHWASCAFQWGEYRATEDITFYHTPTNSEVMCAYGVYTLLEDWWRNEDLPLGETPNGNLLYIASEGGCVPLVELLIDRGADVNLQLQPQHEGWGSALAIAASWGRSDIVKLLIERGADINLQLQHVGYGSALATAAFRGRPEAVQLLIERGADINLQLQHGYYGSALAAAAASKGSTGTVKLLIEEGADINLQLQHGRFGSALAAAAHCGEPEAAQLLLDAGADAGLILEHGRFRTALDASLSEDLSGFLIAFKGGLLKGRAEVAELLRSKMGQQDSS